MFNLSERLIASRKEQGLTQGALAKKAKVSQKTISDLERGRNNNSKELHSIAKALNVMQDYLLTGEEEPLSHGMASVTQCTTTMKPCLNRC
jgi:transcriptional regulator with XRE-family HTH domain